MGAAEKALEIDWWYVLLGIIILITLGKIIWDAIERIYKAVKKKILGDKENDDAKDDLKDLEEKFNEHENCYTELSNNVNALSNELKVTKDEFMKAIDNLSKQMTSMSEKTDETVRARLKDRIAQSYRHYHEKQEWTSMDKEAFLGLIEDYERHGGKNSFVHSICEPELYTWKVIDE